MQKGHTKQTWLNDSQWDQMSRETYKNDAGERRISPYSPMFRVTVMTLSDMVESVTLLKDTD